MRLNRVFSSLWLNHVSQGNVLSWSYFVCQFTDSGYFSATWLLKQVKQISAIEQGELLLAELGRDFLEVEGKGHRSVTAKNWEKGERHEWKF